MSLDITNCGKLGPKFYGSFQVQAHISEMAYQLQLPPTTRLHDIFHVGLLKPYHRASATPTAPGSLPPIKHGRACPVPAEVVRSRLARGHHELLVRWVGLRLANASWAELDEFKRLYLDYQLEDKLIVQEERCHVGRQVLASA
jgi:hypothetical protein